jgi:rhodanese-related sulfurtransferase
MRSAHSAPRNMVMLLLVLAMLVSACDVISSATPLPPTATPKPVFSLAATVDRYLRGLPSGFGAITEAALNEQIAVARPFIIDVRDAAEISSTGTIAGAVNIPVRDLAKNLDRLPAMDQPIVTMCAVGHRGGLAMMSLQLLGYTNVKSLSNGLTSWKDANLPVVVAADPLPAAGKAPAVDRDLLAVLDTYLTALPAGFNTITPAALKDQMVTTKLFIVDTREESEGQTLGVIEGAVSVPLSSLARSLGKLPDDKSTAIVVYSSIGHRGGMSMMTLQLLGFTNVRSLANGFTAWTAAGFPVVK